MRSAVRASLILLALSLAACGPREAPSGGGFDANQALAGAPDGDLVVAVNGELVTQPVLEVFARARGLDLANAEQRKLAVDQLVEAILLAQSGLRGELGQRAEVQAEATLARLMHVSGRQLAHLRETIQVDEAQVYDYYLKESERAGDTDYHLAHILFADEAVAQAAAQRASQPDADFEALMAEYAGAGALQARDLGWGNLTQMPESFPEVVRQLQDGQVAPVAVQSVYGWHVLRRVDSRPFEAPAYEEVKEGARRLLAERALGEKVRALRETAQLQFASGAQ